MNRSRFSPLAILCVLASSPAAMASPLFFGSVSDPAGDSVSGPDIVLAEIRIDSASIHFLMEFAPGTLDPLTTKSGFEIDADQDSATGSPWNGIGVDFGVSQGYLGDTGTAHLWDAGVGFIATAPVSFLGDRVEYSFARGLFGAEDGLLDFIAAVQIALSPASATTIRDFAPNIGSGPASTAAVPEPSILVSLAVGGLSLWLGRRRRSR